MKFANTACAALAAFSSTVFAAPSNGASPSADDSPIQCLQRAIARAKVPEESKDDVIKKLGAQAVSSSDASALHEFGGRYLSDLCEASEAADADGAEEALTKAQETLPLMRAHACYSNNAAELNARIDSCGAKLASLADKETACNRSEKCLEPKNRAIVCAAQIAVDETMSAIAAEKRIIRAAGVRGSLHLGQLVGELRGATATLKENADIYKAAHKRTFSKASCKGLK